MARSELNGMARLGGLGEPCEHVAENVFVGCQSGFDGLAVEGAQGAQVA